MLAQHSCAAKNRKTAVSLCRKSCRSIRRKREEVEERRIRYFIEEI
jgi:hypothetical protein